MGYTTDFRGELELDKPLTIEQKTKLEDFSEERHGGNTQVFPGFPGFWCDWVPNEDGTTIEWNGGEKFYNYVEWLEHIIKHFIEPWGRKLNGVIEWRGEDWDDAGRIIVTDNKITVEER